ncbi:hypothetical protein XA68_14467 [Ophiocordyceps unilateralis]|uniref:Uncharacterized protein n=1 Tax=Ophiocordyceps unilateralis TaxID=268505 RepID=A0A2A9PAE6_OPHUN|nr:hypothetical protein XA68_14467 [Ophiocordyceps unilateralis]
MSRSAPVLQIKWMAADKLPSGVPLESPAAAEKRAFGLDNNSKDNKPGRAIIELLARPGSISALSQPKKSRLPQPYHGH